MNKDIRLNELAELLERQSEGLRHLIAYRAQEESIQRQIGLLADTAELMRVVMEGRKDTGG